MWGWGAPEFGGEEDDPRMARIQSGCALRRGRGSLTNMCPLASSEEGARRPSSETSSRGKERGEGRDNPLRTWDGGSS